MNWHALCVRSNSETQVSRHLQARTVESYYPAWPSLSKRAMRPIPIFPGYVFARFEYDKNPGLVISVPGVMRILGAVPDCEVDAVRKLVETPYSGGLMEHGYIPDGHRVLIQHGPFSGIEGILVQHKTHQRVAVAISMLNRAVSVELDEQWLRDLERNKRKAA